MREVEPIDDARELQVKVLVLGAGVVGTAAAYYLNRAGHEVTVVERQSAAGMETSFANGGHVSAFTSRPWASAAPTASVSSVRSKAMRYSPCMNSVC